MNIATDSSTVSRKTLAICLLMLRLGVGLVFVMWTLDKFVNPGHAAAIFEKFYKIPGLTRSLTYAIGAAQMLVIVAFLVGAFRSASCLVILLLHAISTFSSYARYLDPWTSPNLLFFAAFPMLAACLTLWLLREFDTMCSVDHWRLGRKPI